MGTFMVIKLLACLDNYNICHYSLVRIHKIDTVKHKLWRRLGKEERKLYSLSTQMKFSHGSLPSALVSVQQGHLASIYFPSLTNRTLLHQVTNLTNDQILFPIFRMSPKAMWLKSWDPNFAILEGARTQKWSLVGAIQIIRDSFYGPLASLFSFV